MAKGKQRIDILLVEQGLSPSREKAKAAILAGLVKADGQKVQKPGEEVSEIAVLQLEGPSCPYVSRGGYKLEKALQCFPIALMDKTVLDIGASTGGFTDCALQNGASKVFAVDVGYGQLAWSLRSDPRVVCKERTNARYLTLAELGEQADTVTIDVAFISLTKILPAVKELIKAENDIIALVKPQFEAGRDKVGKKGVVKDPVVHREVLQRVMSFATSNGYAVMGLSFSPVKGPEGNIEYLAWLKLGDYPSLDLKNLIETIVDNAHSEL